MNGYEKRTQLKMSKIIDAAKQLFVTQGLEKTTITEIANKANVAPATVYNYFETKEGLILAVAKTVIDTSLTEKKKLWNSELPFDQLLEQAIVNQDLFLTPENLVLLEIFLNESGDTNKFIQHVFEVEYPRLLEIFIQKGQAEGFIKHDISPKTLMLYLKMYQTILKDPDLVKTENKQILKELYELLLYGLVGK
ncbi:TetR/AcrR family transcriptional regulator [Enterococcus saccharolyticus]|uniref:TetR/AcrR family transcriptional regulator n=1 Tax=Enterococcus saccharolyticus TaxID=41997 RepID=UPI001E4D11BF|nr:TetR/AcrR family transcriptional regulator [Enterococcus saccharolyticus]MCD5003663.1 TetR/AcrR family transcriptional regulator [Enterococcus saccharolyticus]